MYWPKNYEHIKNADFKDLIQNVRKALRDQPVVLDRHGCFKKPEFVGLLPEPLEQLNYDEKYERALSDYNFGDGFYDEDDSDDSEKEDTFTFIKRRWVKEFKNELEEIGVEYLDHDAWISMLRVGPPGSVKLNSDGSVRRFIRQIIKFVEWIREDVAYYSLSRVLNNIKQCPIFPIKIRGGREWGCIDDEVMWGDKEDLENDTGNTYSGEVYGTSVKRLDTVTCINFYDGCGNKVSGIFLNDKELDLYD